MSQDGFDVVIIGAGVIGLAIAARLATPTRSVLILERESGPARGITSRNSEVIHAGLYYPAESHKARWCVEGRERLYAYCAERRVGHRRLGKLVVATEAHEIAILEELGERGRANGVARLDLIDESRVRAIEPEVRALAALESPDTGIVDGHGLCLALLAEAESEGAVLALEREVTALESKSHGWRLDVRAGGSTEALDAGIVIDAAGLDADRIARRAGIARAETEWRQHPCKGDYFSLGPGGSVSLSRLIYPVPAQAGLGIHATLDLAGRLRFGPDATYTDALDFDVDPKKADRFREAAARYLPSLEGAHFLPDYAGIRPKLAGPGEAFRDFVVEECSAHGAPGFIACLGIESPGLTAALALADHVGGLVD